MALKLSTGTDGVGEWDILLANSGTAAATRVLPLPAASWSRAHYSSLMPYAKAGGPVRSGGYSRRRSARIRPAHRWTRSARSLATAPLHFDLSLASASGEVVPAGHLVLSQILRLDDNMHPSFDPVLNCPRRTRIATRTACDCAPQCLPWKPKRPRNWPHPVRVTIVTRTGDAGYADIASLRWV
ncbi:hypothetical protein [Rhodococcus sp. 24CO]|uniref:hypothetical protein n=1 Tax=Rhodococcus sp. 24CO TaxID=3117460 RepID=UPI003D34ECAF